MGRDNIEFEQVIERVCGLDVHRDTVVATVMGKGLQTQTRTFGTTTSSLKELGKGLTGLKVSEGAMESTGIYWKPVLHVLREYPINLIVVNARHIKNVPGRKTDKADSQWICKLLISGLLKSSFIPPENIQELRDLHRYKKKPVGTIASEKNRIIRVLEKPKVEVKIEVEAPPEPVVQAERIVEVIKEVEVIREVVVEKIVEVQVPAPHVQLPLEDWIQKVEDLTMLIERYKTLAESRRKLQTFQIGADGMSSAIALRDAAGNEFKTSNSAVISAVIDTMKNILDGKIADVQEQISF